MDGIAKNQKNPNGGHSGAVYVLALSSDDTLLVLYFVLSF